MLARFFWLENGVEIPGPILEKDNITAEDTKAYALPDSATSGVMRIQDGPEWPCPPRDYLAITDDQLRNDHAKRVELILWLRARAFWAMVDSGVNPGTALGRGQQFAGRYGRELYAYEFGSAPDFRVAMVGAPEEWLETEVSPGKSIRQLFLDSIPASSVSPTPPNFITLPQRDDLLARVAAATTVSATKGILADLIELLCPG